MIAWLQRFWCHHRRRDTYWRFIRNVHGGEVDLAGGCRSIWRCKLCGATGYGDRVFLGKDQDVIGPVVIKASWLG